MSRNISASHELRSMLSGDPPSTGPDWVGQNFSARADLIERWRQAFPNVPDIHVELQVFDDWLTETPLTDGKVLHRASRWLANANEKHKRSSVDARLDEIYPPEIYGNLQ